MTRVGEHAIVLGASLAGWPPRRPWPSDSNG